MDFPKKDPIVDKLADELDLNALYLEISRSKDIMKCIHCCENETTHECIVCMDIVCNNWACCPHPAWYRRFRWWLRKIWQSLV